METDRISLYYLVYSIRGVDIATTEMDPKTSNKCHYRHHMTSWGKVDGAIIATTHGVDIAT